MRRFVSLAVVALGFFTGNFLQAQTRVAGAINFNESCCAIGMRGPSVPAGGNRTTVAVTGIPQRDFHHRDGMRRDHFDGNRNHFRNNGFGGYSGYPYYYPYYGYSDTSNMDQTQPANNYEQPADDEGPGLTVFERRKSYQLIGDSPQYQRDQQSQRATDTRADEKSAGKNDGEGVTAAAAPPEEVVSTILVFRDGSHREIRNYALMGNGIYDLSVKAGQGKMKILLADLDIPATIAANDQRGIDFKVPNQ
jgi:hypothetical protein